MSIGEQEMQPADSHGKNPLDRYKKGLKIDIQHEPYLFHLTPNATDRSNSSTFKSCYFKIRGKHIFYECCILENLARVTNKFEFLHYSGCMIELKHNCGGCDPKCCLANIIGAP